MSENDDDAHNPFGDSKPKKHEPGIFDPDYKGHGHDPFHGPPDESRWETPEPDKVTEDV